MDAVIRCAGLTKSYGGRKVVDRLDLAVPRGAVAALLGDNGAGKSTTFRLLTGQVAPDAGRCEVLGQDCWADAVKLRSRVGYCPERPKFYDWMTADEVGSFAAAFHPRGFRDRYLGLLARFAVGPSAKLKTLSKGGYAKVGLALALASEPDVLLLDEPTSGLDLFTRREFLTSMAALAGDGRTILISSHSVAEVERVVSHVAFVYQGKLLLAGPIDELRTRLVALRVRGGGVETHGLGEVLDEEADSRDWRAVVLDPTPGRLEELSQAANVEQSVPTLEEMYTALLARYHRPAAAAKLQEVRS